MNNTHPFAKSTFRRQVARIEFDVFQEKAYDAVKAASETIPRFTALERNFGFYVKNFHPDTVQIFFGQRSMFRKDIEGKTASERGLCLLYSLGPTGDVAVTIYPCNSSLGKVTEDHIYIGLGRFSAYRLLNRVQSDMRLLVAYGYVSSLDTDPTWQERLRIAWLRRIKPSQIDGKFVANGRVLLTSSIKAAFSSAASGAFAALMRPLGTVIIIIVLIYFFGHGDWVDILKGK